MKALLIVKAQVIYSFFIVQFIATVLVALLAIFAQTLS